MNGYHNPERANPGPAAATYSPDPGAVAEELLQVGQPNAICLISDWAEDIFTLQNFLCK